MTRITFQDGKVVMRDGKVGTEEACCCGDECECPTDCDVTVSVDLDYCGMQANLSFPAPGFDSVNVQGVNSIFDYLTVEASVFCGELGPDGECGWLLSILICYQCDNVANGEGFTGFIEQDSNGCPKTGAVTLTCFGDQFGIPCVTAPTASVA